MKSKILFTFIGLFLLNCAKTTYYLKDPNAKVRFSAFSEDEGYKIKRRFEKTATRINLFWGLTRYDEKDLDSLVMEELGRNREENAIGNLTVREHYTFLDSLVDFIVIGLVRPYSVTVSGIVYKYSGEKEEADEEKDSDVPKRRTKKKADSDDDEPKTKSKKKKIKESEDPDESDAKSDEMKKMKSGKSSKNFNSKLNKKTEDEADDEESSKKEGSRKKGK